MFCFTGSSVLSFLVLSWLSLTLAWSPNSVNGPDLFRHATSAKFDPRYYPSVTIRGVNLGSLFVFEPWMGTTAWEDMGCGDTKSEFGCVLRLGREKADAAFQEHWRTWINETDFPIMKSYGLNTIRIPVGYWMKEDLVDSSEYFPRGGFEYLKQICEWAAKSGMYVYIDMHGAPGAQMMDNANTGQYHATPGFYNSDYNYERAYKFLEWITTEIHSHDSFRTVGALGVLNEPTQGQLEYTKDCIDAFYPTAIKRIRAAEDVLGVAEEARIDAVAMDKLWAAGDPVVAIQAAVEAVVTTTDNHPDTATSANLEPYSYDSHSYIKDDFEFKKKYNGHATPQQYLDFVCKMDVTRDNNLNKVVGEFSISVDTAGEKDAEFEIMTDNNKEFYKKYFAAQQQKYEAQSKGWIFWSWRVDLWEDYRWGYMAAIDAGVIDRNLNDNLARSPCT